MGNTYILTKHGVIGLSRKISDEGVTYNPIIDSKTFDIVKKVHPDDIYCQDTNFAIIKSKYKQLRKETFEELFKYKNIVLDIESILFKIFYTSGDCGIKAFKRLSRFFKVFNLSLVHLKNFDSYVILNLDESRNKNIKIKSTILATSHIIGSRGSNITRIKEEIGVKNISVIDISVIDFDVVKKDFENLIIKSRFFLSKNIYL